MKNIFTLLFSFLFFLNLAGCATWEGMRKDSADAWEKSKLIGKYMHLQKNINPPL